VKVKATVEYEKIDQIGAGQGMNSEVFRARDPQLEGMIAVKEVEKARFGNDISQYYEEAQAIYASSHTNIVPVHYAGENGTHICLAMPYFKNGSLLDRIKNGALQLSEIIRISQEVLSGLTSIHLAGLIHFDLKPSNVLFSDDGSALVADFGQSRRITGSGVVQVPMLYRESMPPEVIGPGIGSLLCDIYQMGVLLYRASNGEPFYQLQVPAAADLPDKISNGRFPKRDEFMPHVPRRLRTIIRKAMQVDPGKRYQSATEFADALAGIEINLDWLAIQLSGGGLAWKAARKGRPSLIIELKPAGAMWSVEAYTESAGVRRRNSVSAIWRKGIAFKKAISHLKDVFEQFSK
jgi:eukaryotic-like serine/threonine-protein kinase